MCARMWDFPKGPKRKSESMVRIKRYANGVERFLHSPRGERFFNIAYSVGAAVVIAGVLLEILHVRWGNLVLCIGMGTEIAMFLLMAFDTGSLREEEENGESAAQVSGMRRVKDPQPQERLPATPAGLSEGHTEALAELGESLARLRDMYARSAEQSARYCEETEKMTRYVVQLNAVYRKMIEAMAAGLAPEPGKRGLRTDKEREA